MTKGNRIAPRESCIRLRVKNATAESLNHCNRDIFFYLRHGGPGGRVSNSPRSPGIALMSDNSRGNKVSHDAAARSPLTRAIALFTDRREREREREREIVYDEHRGFRENESRNSKYHSLPCARRRSHLNERSRYSQSANSGKIPADDSKRTSSSYVTFVCRCENHSDYRRA